MKRRSRKYPQNRNFGFSILELLIVLVVFGILSSMAVPNGVQLIRYDLRHQALLQMRAVRNAEGALAICQAQAIQCPAVQAQIPATGSLQTTGYIFSFSQNGSNWSYTAVPLAPNSSYYASQDGNIRFSDSGSTAGPTSPVIQ